MLAGEKLPRTSVRLKQDTTINKLRETAEGKKVGTFLRIYWYDGVLSSGPSAEQLALADADGVKLRLGVVNPFGKQKGVDSLIVTDLVELARNHAITDAILLSGDEDVRIGVQIAQGFGVRVHLIGIGSTGASQARTLMQEADTTSEWNEDDIQDVMELKSAHDSLTKLEDREAVEEVDDEISSILSSTVDEMVDLLLPEQLSTLAKIEVGQQIPKEFDSRLLGASRSKIDRILDEKEKRLLRDLFKQAVKNTRESQ